MGEVQAGAKVRLTVMNPSLPPLRDRERVLLAVELQCDGVLRRAVLALLGRFDDDHAPMPLAGHDGVVLEDRGLQVVELILRLIRLRNGMAPGRYAALDALDRGLGAGQPQKVEVDLVAQRAPCGMAVR